MVKDAICFVDVSKTGYNVLADAIVDFWQTTGEKPTEERFGKELVDCARERWLERKRSQVSSSSEG